MTCVSACGEDRTKPGGKGAWLSSQASERLPTLQSASRNYRYGNNKVETGATLNDAWPRVHGQVVVVIVQVVKDALLHQRLVDAFLENSFEVCPGLLSQVNVLIYYLTG